MTIDEEIQEYINNKCDVFINHSNETDDTGKYVYAVQVMGTDFWLNAFKLKKDAIKYCKDNGLRIITTNNKW